MESKLRTLSYNQTAKFVVGKKDGNTELVIGKFEVDSYGKLGITVNRAFPNVR